MKVCARLAVSGAFAVLAVGGLWVWVFVRQLGRHPLVPRHDPALVEVGE